MRLEEVARLTSDADRAVEFYETSLGIKPAWKTADAAEFLLGDVKLFIH